MCPNHASNEQYMKKEIQTDSLRTLSTEYEWEFTIISLNPKQFILQLKWMGFLYQETNIWRCK